MMWRVLLSLAIASALGSSAVASPEPPCDGCAIAFPEREGPVPLLVVLHGDHGQATHWLARWRDAALDHGWAVLSLQCPEDLGCEEGVWYRWDGDPQWILQQIDKLAEGAEIDRSQLYLAGWSGGAAYLGMHMRSWQGFAGLVMHGGGVTPRDGRCAKPAPPVYFLVGDKNQYHQSTVWFRDHLRDCRARVKWDLLKGGYHPDEDKALDPAKAGEILEWLIARGR